MTPEIRKLLEIAGTLDQHVNEEKKIFEDVCSALKKLQTFCDKQNEDRVYGPVSEYAGQLCDKLTKHLQRYKK